MRFGHGWQVGTVPAASGISEKSDRAQDERKGRTTLKLRETKATAQNAPAAPTTVAEWRKRAEELEREITAAGQVLAERRTERQNAAGAALALGGAASEMADMEIAELEAAELAAERRVDNLRCGVEFARRELAKLDELELRAKLEAQAVKRAAIQEQILQTAGAIDELCLQAASKLRALDTLLSDFRVAGGQCSRVLKGCFMRAQLHAGMRDFIVMEHVGNQNVVHSLRAQLDMTPRPADKAASNPGNPEQFVTLSRAGEYPA